MELEFLSQHLQCSRDDKRECLHTIKLLAELAHAEKQGIRTLENLIEDNPLRFSSPFLLKAMQLLLDVKDNKELEKILYNYIISSNYTGQLFLNAVIIAEAAVSIHRHEEIDHIFQDLLPSYFGLDYQSEVEQVYQQVKADIRASKIQMRA